MSTDKKQDFQGIIGILLIVAAVWHIIVWNDDEVILTGIFKKKPQTGYVWENTFNDATPKFFWSAPDVQWQPGTQHPTYNVMAANQVGQWMPLPGYVFTGTEGLNTLWKSGLKHPNMDAYSSTVVGRWLPTVGYRFVMQNGLATGTTWDSGKRYDNLKIVAGSQKDTYYTFPGYTFLNPQLSLAVRWTPGVKNPNNSSLVSGQTEGSWEYANAYTTTAGDHFKNFLGTGLSGKAIEWLFGENRVSNYLYQESTRQATKAIVKVVQ